MTGVAALRRQISGEVFVQGDSHYERLRLGWDTTLQQFPALIVVPRSVADVVAAQRHLSLRLSAQRACSLGGPSSNRTIGTTTTSCSIGETTASAIPRSRLRLWT